MAYNEKLAERVRKLLARRRGLVERKMFGGIAFMLRGNMCCGVLNDDLILRMGPELGEQALQRRNTREFDFTGRPMKGFVVVEPAGTKSKAALEGWLQKAVGFVKTLPPK